MAQNVISGALAYLNYGFESTYGTAVTAGRTFGHGIKGSIKAKNNMERVYGLGSRNASASVAKNFEGSCSAEFDLSHGSFFREVLGAVADSGSAPYVHTYTEANTLPSTTLIAGAELGTNDMIYTMAGAKVNSCELTAAVNEVVKVKLEHMFKSVSVATSTVGSQVAPTEDIFSFAQGTLTFAGSTVAYVQNFTLTIKNTLEMIYGLGARTASAGVEKNREYDLKFTISLNDPSIFIAAFLGDASAPYTPNSSVAATAALVLTFTNGLTGANERSITITLANIYLDEHSFNLDPNETIKEDVTGHALSCTSIVWKNNTASDSASP